MQAAIADAFVPSTLLRGVGDKGRIHLSHVRTLARRTGDFSLLVFLQGQNQQRFLPTVEALIIIHRHEDFLRHVSVVYRFLTSITIAAKADQWFLRSSM